MHYCIPYLSLIWPIFGISVSQMTLDAFVVHSDRPGNKWLVNLDLGLHKEIKVLTVEFPDQILNDSHYRLFVLKYSPYLIKYSTGTHYRIRCS